MEAAAGAMRPLLAKLGELIRNEYGLGKKVKKGLMSLETELEMMHKALDKVASVPLDQLDEQVRELSYDMEDAIDSFMVRVDGCEPSSLKKNRVKKFLKKTTGLYRKGKDLHQIARAIEEAQELAKQLAELRQRYELDVHDVSAGAAIDPRVMALYKDETELIGIEQPRDELIKRLFHREEGSKHRLRTISIVGFGGLGKTTLAKVVYDKIKVQFDCTAFVSVSRSPDVTKIFKKILYELERGRYANINEAERDQVQLIDELRRFLEDKRYLIVIDDIWDEKLCGFIKCAFTVNNLGSRLITTTRKVSVSEACCSSCDDIIYRMKHLSDVDSQRLFYKRIFSHEDGCPHELVQVSRDILKKCGGVPLAIITIASVLSSPMRSKTNDKWDALLNSIGHGLAEGDSMEEMQKVLSLSYYDLPSHLKTCLLYLSIFPEDYEIPRDQLIWIWIAEGFVKCEKHETSLFDFGDSYFNELINRSMIQPIDINVEGKARACRVHDMVLDLILHVSTAKNFVTTFDGIQRKTSSQIKVRRLALQNSVVEPTMPQVTMSMSQVRSVIVFMPAINLMPPLSSFHVLRVLDIEGCELHNLRYVGNLYHLRYLRLRSKNYPLKSGELPLEIGNLQFLQTIDIIGLAVEELPWAFVQLRQLMCLRVGENTRLPGEMGNLASLEVLSTVFLDESPNFVKQFQSLTRLRELSMLAFEMDMALMETLVESLCKLQKIETLDVQALPPLLNLIGNSWVPPPYLRRFFAHGPFLAMPTWIKRDPSLLSNLSVLTIQFMELSQEDLQILGRLPALLSLELDLTDQDKLLIGADGFHCLKVFKIWIFSCDLMFQLGAMPRVENIRFSFSVRQAKDGGNADFDFGLGNLLSLEHIDVVVRCYEVTNGEVEEAEAALRHVAQVHPNHPTPKMGRVGAT
uniref:NB-ARC domain-containing protein n=1 Tax=Oryza barthii TaxID=65489 RepID=A0A0D3HNG0_9ORYZ